jgi:outer membrane receptor protein involved in Fe transport
MRVILALFLLAPIVALAQTAEITGRVMDPTGALVARADVSVTNVDAGTRLQAQTNNEGYFTVSRLDPGRYRVEVRSTGFKAAVRSGIVLQVEQVARLDFTLEVGGVNEKVEVIGTAPLVESETSSVGQVITNKSIVEIPLNGRNAWDLSKLSGATVYVSGIGDAGEIPVVSMAGSRTKSQELMLDGGSVQKSGLATAQAELQPMVDAVEEFKVVANNYAAEYGRSAAGVFIAVTKSGTNQFKGSVFEFFRNDAMDARNFFSAGKAPLRFNQFGGTLGGPIRKDKTHFFLAFEGTESTKGSTQILSLPTAAERTGDFSGLLNAQGRVIPLYNPLTTRVDPANANNRLRDPFPGNVIPLNLLDPVAVKASSYYPLPNQAGTITGASNFNINLGAKRTQYHGTVRVDHVASEKDRLYVRYVNQHNYTPQANVYPEPAASGIGPVTRDINNLAHTYLASWVRTVSSSLLNDLKFSGTGQVRDITHASYNQGWPTKLGLKGFGDESFPNLAPQGFSALGANNVFRAQTNPFWQILENLSWYRGKHSFKTGFEYRRQATTDEFDTQPSGNFSFVAAGTGLLNNAATGNGYASMMMGFVSQVQVINPPQFRFTNWGFGAFLQDDWKVTSRLTLNLGLRYDIEPGRHADNGTMSGFDLAKINPAAGVPGVVTFAGVDGMPNSNYNTDRNNVAPRMGFAWKPLDKTVIRGAFGAFFGNPDDQGFNNTAVLGFATQSLLVSPDANQTPALWLKNGYPGTLTAPGPQDRTPSFGVGSGVDFYQRERAVSYSLQSNFGIQREVRSFLISGEYLGNMGRKLTAGALSMNQIAPNRLGQSSNLQSLRPFPQFTAVTLDSPNLGSSTYHAFLLRVERRYANGLQFLMNYTFSKMLDNVNALTDLGGEPGYQDYYNRGLDKSISSLDVTHNVSGSVVWDLPWGPGRRWMSSGALGRVVGGWEVSTLVTVRSGPAYGVTTQTNTCQCFSAGPQRANILSNPDLPAGQRSVQKWFDTAAFAQPATYMFGNAARAVGRSPGASTINLALMKNFQPVDRLRVQLRGEFFNAFNHANFGNPASTFGGPGFGTITSAADARVVQIGLKIYF